MYSIINLSLNKLIMCLAIEINSKLTILLIMNKKTKFDLILIRINIFRADVI